MDERGVFFEGARRISSDGISGENAMTHKEHDPSKSPASVQPVESEGTSVDEGKKTEQQKVLKHNVETGQHQRHPEEVAGQHATGSFTNKK
jgi:hypothetical protein